MIYLLTYSNLREEDDGESGGGDDGVLYYTQTF